MRVSVVVGMERGYRRAAGWRQRPASWRVTGGGSDTGLLRHGSAGPYAGRMEGKNAPKKASGKRAKRQSGGQPGNRNSVKHGFYSSFMSPADRRKLKEASGVVGLKNEIASFRVLYGKMMTDPNVTPSQLAAALSVLSRVEAIQRRLFDAQDEEGDRDLMAVAERLAEVIGVSVGEDGNWVMRELGGEG